MMNKHIDQPKNGLLYITYGRKYVQAAIHSANTARNHCPGILIHMFVDQKCYEEFGFAKDPSPFTSVGVIENPHRRSKVDYISQTPFDNTLYMDSDTTVAQDISGVFGVLERFDMAATHAQRRNGNRANEYWTKPIPSAYPHFNGGIILYRRTPKVVDLLRNWSVAFAESGSDHDQATLRELIWDSDLRMATLPPEYNVRYLKYKFLWSRSEAMPMIYHLKQYHIGWMPWYREQVKDFIIYLADALSMPFRKLFGTKSIQESRKIKRLAKKKQ